MKKILLSGALLTSFIFGEQLKLIPIDKSLLSHENGGSKSAIDAYSDGIGIVTESNQKIDNEPMNELVYTYGEKAKESGETLKNFSLNNGNNKEQDLAKKLGIINNEELTKIGDPCNDGNSKTINDIYTDTIGTCKGYYNNESCNDVKINEGKNTNGYYNIYINGEIKNVYCKMDIDEGGWTLLFEQKEYTNISQINEYTNDISLIKNSKKTLIAYSDEEFNLNKAITFNTIESWKSGVPFNLPGTSTYINYDVVSTKINKNGIFMVGKENFSASCSDSFTGSTFGKICMVNDVEAPFFNGFQSTNTYCSQNQYYGTNVCSKTNHFVIFVK